MAEQAYTAFYTAILRAALRCLDERALRLFIALCSYADARGLCFPGVRELADVTGYSVEDVIALLARLEAEGLIAYVRRDEHDPVTRRQLPNVYAVHNGFYLAREVQEVAGFSNISERLELLRKKPDRHYGIFSIHNQNQEQESRISSSKPAAEPPPQPPTDPRKEGDPTPWAAQSEDQSDALPTRSVTNEVRIPLPPARREPADLMPYQAPLADAACERLAMEIISFAGNISHPNARMLVDVYGLAQARGALVLFNMQPRNSIPNPAGYIRALLRKHAISPEDPQQSPSEGDWGAANLPSWIHR